MAAGSRSRSAAAPSLQQEPETERGTWGRKRRPKRDESVRLSSPKPSNLAVRHHQVPGRRQSRPRQFTSVAPVCDCPSWPSPPSPLPRGPHPIAHVCSSNRLSNLVPASRLDPTGRLREAPCTANDGTTPVPLLRRPSKSIHLLLPPPPSPGPAQKKRGRREKFRGNPSTDARPAIRKLERRLRLPCRSLRLAAPSSTFPSSTSPLTGSRLESCVFARPPPTPATEHDPSGKPVAPLRQPLAQPPQRRDKHPPRTVGPSRPTRQEKVPTVFFNFSLPACRQPRYTPGPDRPAASDRPWLSCSSPRRTRTGLSRVAMAPLDLRAP